MKTLHDIPVEVSRPVYFWRIADQPCPIYSNCRSSRLTSDWAHATIFFNERNPANHALFTFFCTCSECRQSERAVHYWWSDNVDDNGYICPSCEAGNHPRVGE